MAIEPPKTTARAAGARPATPPAAAARKPLRDNPLLILLWIALLLAGLTAMVTLADRSTQLSTDFLSEIVLYAVSIADLTLMIALAFVLARNVLKLIVERRRALPFARFRAKLVAVLLGMTLIPAILVLIVGSELIRNSANRWFSAPIDEVLSSAREIASDYYEERQLAVTEHAGGVARALAGVDLSAGNVAAIRGIIAPEITHRQLGLIEVYRIVERGSPPEVSPVVDVASPILPSGFSRASADLLAVRTASGSENLSLEPLRNGGELVRAAALIRPAADAPPTGVVVVSDYLTGELARHSRRITDAYEAYAQLRVLRRPLEGVYLSLFLGLTLLILVSATWMGLYLAKRITRPIQMLAEGAREIGAGHLDHRIEPETVDEFGSLVDAFNKMAGELAVSRRRLERSRLEIERKNLEAEERRRYLEAILERIATGVICLDAQDDISIINTAARRLIGLDDAAIGQPASLVLEREDLRPLGLMLQGSRRAASSIAEEVALVRDGREMHLAVATTTLHSEDGAGGAVVVLDDVTPLMRAQKVAAWRDVARRLAHEIKNPLTPIQLSAERLRRHFASAPEPARRLVDECSTAIVTEVESLKSLVDEFSQFARMPAPRTVPSDLHQLLTESLGLYAGLLERVRIEPRFAPSLPLVRVDPEQLRRVVINLIDNAIEALNGARELGLELPDPDAVITVETSHDEVNGVVRVSVADNGPGLPAGDRTKLFMPYYSTKGRGSGLGLAIVRRIIAEHGGNIEAGDNHPHGTRFTIELPC
jgi:two-component system nitrogen regulation sensor histidine kinase NtrY